MTPWFLDATVLLACEDTDDDQHEPARALLLGGATLATLDLAYYEVANVAVRAWRDAHAAARLQAIVTALGSDGGLVRIDEQLAANALQVAEREGLSVYDAGYVVGAASLGSRLVSCDLRDLVSRGLAVTPAQARSEVED